MRNHIMRNAFNQVFQPALRGVFPFRVSQLFSQGEAGAWFAPSDIDALFQDTAGTTPVTAAGQPVALARDKSGNSSNAEQGTSGSRPLYAVRPATGTRNLTDYSQVVSATVAPDQGYFANNLTGIRAGSSGVVNDDTQTPEIPFYWRTTATAYQLFGFVPSGSLVSGQTYTLRMRVRSFGTNITSFSAFASSIVSSTGFPVASSDGWKDVTVVFVANGQRILAPTGNNSNWGYVRFQIEAGATATAYQKVATRTNITEAGVKSLPYLTNISADSLNWTAAAGDYTIAYNGAAGAVILDAQALSGATDVMQSTEIYEYIAVDRPLGSAERRRLQDYLNRKLT